MSRNLRLGGPARFRHQQLGLQKAIATKGVFALLFDPGTGKTATTLDYCSLLTHLSEPMPDGTREARVLVIAPLAAIDQWVLQAGTWLSPDIDYWAEALGGTIIQRAEALASRGDAPYRQPANRRRQKVAQRALHVHRSLALSTHAPDRGDAYVAPSEGPEGVGSLTRPRLVLVSMNLDAFSSRQAHKSGTYADLLLDAVKRFAPDLVIVDESHKIKGNSSNVSKLLARIGQRVKRRGILTGTVMPHGPLDVFGQWRFLNPQAFTRRQWDGTMKPMSFDVFRSTYGVIGGYMGREVVAYKNLDDMQDRMALNAVVAKKRDVLPDLPKATPVIVPVNLSPAEAKAYAEMKKQLATDVSGGGGIVASAGSQLTAMMRLRQVTSGFLPGDDGQIHWLGPAADPSMSKVKAIDSIVNDTLAGEQRIVVFCEFLAEMDALEQRLVRKGTVISRIDGDVPADTRLFIRKRFGDRSRDERHVLIAQVATLSLAVNELVVASNAVFGSLPITRDDLVQARDRLDRIGQELPVTFWFPMVTGTVDEVMYETHEKRGNLENAMLAHVAEESLAA